MAWLVFGEIPTLFNILGLGIAAIAVALTSFSKVRFLYNGQTVQGASPVLFPLLAFAQAFCAAADDNLFVALQR